MSKSSSFRVPENWRARPLTPIADLPAIAGFSAAKGYQLAANRVLDLRRVAGRTFVTTASLTQLLDNAPQHDARANGHRTAAANAARRQAATQAWEA